MNKNLDHLIPTEILELLQLDRFDIKISLKTHKCNSVVSILVDNNLAFQGIVDQQYDFEFTSTLAENQTSCNVQLLLAPSTERYQISVDSIVVNDVDIVKHNIIRHVLHVPSAEHYNGTLDSENNPLLSMTFEVPILSYFSELNANIEQSEKGPWDELIDEIYSRVLICMQLEKENKIISSSQHLTK